MYYGGIDAHAKYQIVTIVDKSGQRVVSATRVETRLPQRLRELLEPYRPLRVVVEASPFWPWIYDLLTPEGIEVVLAHAKRLRAIAEADQKSDRLAADLLARMLQAGLIPRVFPKPPAQRDRARLVRHRVVLMRKRTMLLNRIHSQLHPHGLSLPRGQLKTRKGRRWVREVGWPRLSPESRALVRSHLRLVATLEPMVRSLDRRIERVGAEIPAVGLLRTVPGIGPFRALLLATEILPIERFQHPGKLVSYVGLAPRTAGSGGKIRHGPIPKGANRWARGALVTAVVSHVRHAPQSPLSAYYERQKARLGWQKARVATARKLCRCLYSMLRTGEVWRG